MGLYRQAVQPLVDALAKDGLVEFIDNPDHRRAKLIRMTSAGRRAYVEALSRQVDWSNRTASGLSAQTLAQTNDFLVELIARLREARET
jgi:DNA-binding MarR family transcriptional regulator